LILAASANSLILSWLSFYWHSPGEFCHGIWPSPGCRVIDRWFNQRSTSQHNLSSNHYSISLVFPQLERTAISISSLDRILFKSLGRILGAAYENMDSYLDSRIRKPRIFKIAGTDNPIFGNQIRESEFHFLDFERASSESTIVESD
jgi:hypothetical protein